MAEVSSFFILWFNSRRSNDPSGFGNCTMCFVISCSAIVLSGQKLKLSVRCGFVRIGCGSFGLCQSQQRNSLRFEVSGDVFRMPAEDHVDFGMLLQFFERVRPSRVQQTSASYELRRQTCFSQMTDFACPVYRRSPNA